MNLNLKNSKKLSTIQKVFLDAIAKWDQLSNEEQNYINKLKDAIYDADDLFDEIRTLAELNKLHKFNWLGMISSKQSRDIRDFKNRLDNITAELKKFCFDVEYKSIIRRREETWSDVDANGIIGREEDKEKIVNMLLDPNAGENVSFLSIMGARWQGKTALAQLVFNDERIRQEFSDRHWVCLSNRDRKLYDYNAIILCKITGQELDGPVSDELVQKLSGRK